MSADAGKVTGGIDWDISSYAKGMLQAETIAKIFPEVVTSFIANPLLGLVDIAKGAFDAVDKSIEFGIDGMREYASTVREVAMADAEAAESARTLGLSVETYTALAGAAKLAGADAMAMSEGIKFLNRNMADAAYGNQELRKEFWQLGVSVVDATGHVRDSQDVFFDVADAIAALPDAAQQMRFAMDLLGRSSDQLLPMLAKGSSGIRQYMQIAERLGATTSKSAGEAGEQFKLLKGEWDLLWNGIESAIAGPTLDEINKNFGSIQDAMIWFSDFSRKEITFGFEWIMQHRAGIEKDFGLVETAAKNAIGWIEGDHPKLAEIFKEMKVGAKSAADAIRGIYAGWVQARNALEAYTAEVGDREVKAANDHANKVLKNTGKLEPANPYPHAMPGYNQNPEDWEYIAMGQTPPSPALTKKEIANYHVSVTNQIDPSKVASEVLKQMLPGMKKAMTDLHQKTQAAGRHAAQRKGL